MSSNNRAVLPSDMNASTDSTSRQDGAWRDVTKVHEPLRKCNPMRSEGHVEAFDRHTVAGGFKPKDPRRSNSWRRLKN